MALDTWYERYKNYLAERAENTPKRYKHRRLHGTYRSLKTHLEAPFRFEKNSWVLKKQQIVLRGYLVKLNDYCQHIMA